MRAWNRSKRPEASVRDWTAQTRIVKAEAAVPGSRFKGYEDFIVQDIVIKPWTVLYRRERWLSPSGKTVVAALPQGAASHFGPSLKRFILSQYHQGQGSMDEAAIQLGQPSQWAVARPPRS